MIPLRDPVERTQAVTDLIKHQFYGIEDRPLLKADARRTLLAQADQAAKAGARLLALSVAPYAGVPVPASLLVHWIDVPQDESGSGLLQELQDSMTPPAGTALPAGESLDIGRMPPGPALRHVHNTAGKLEEGSDPAPSLGANYWIERPDGTGLVQLAFATPLVELRESMLGLFDAIVETLRWIPATT